MDHTAISEASKVVMRDRDPEVIAEVIDSTQSDPTMHSANGFQIQREVEILSCKWVKNMFSVQSDVAIAPDLRAARKQYRYIMDERVALVHVRNLLQKYYFLTHRCIHCSQAPGNPELAAETDPAKPFVESDPAWHRYNSMIPFTVFAVSNVASAIIAALRTIYPQRVLRRLVSSEIFHTIGTYSKGNITQTCGRKTPTTLHW